MTTDYNPDLEAALDFEANEIGMDLESMMAEFLDNADRNGETAFDEMRVRRMILAIRHIERETEQMKRYKKAIVADWDRRIKAKEKNIEQIKDAIHGFLVNENNGKGLQLDVATVSVRKVKPSFEIEKAKIPLLRTYLDDAGVLQNFLKPAVLDETLAKNEIANMVTNKIVPLESVSELGEYRPESTSITIRMK